MIYHATEAAKPMPCDVPLSVVLFPVVHPVSTNGRIEKQDMGEVRSYPKKRKPKVYIPRDRAAEHRKRIQKMAADLRAKTYSFMDGMGWITIKTMAELRNVEECNIGRSLKLLVADKVVQKKMLGKTALYRWVKK